MKKKYIIIIVILLAILTCVFILKNNNSKFAGKADSVSSIKGVSISVKEYTLAHTDTVIIIKNETDSDIETGTAFSIDKEVNGKWMKLKTKHDTFWNLVSIIIPSNSSRELECNWEDIYGKLEKGTYRLVKEINSKRIAVEFELED